MNTITVENVNYKFEEIPGKGKCLVPVENSALDEFIQCLKSGLATKSDFSRFVISQPKNCLVNLELIIDPYTGSYAFMYPGTIKLRALYGVYEVKDCCFFRPKNAREFMANHGITVSFAK
jgi:hypothetical protein